jgi:hypothetical protein
LASIGFVADKIQLPDINSPQSVSPFHLLPCRFGQSVFIIQKNRTTLPLKQTSA